MANPFDLIFGGRGRLERRDEQDEQTRAILDQAIVDIGGAVPNEPTTPEERQRYLDAGYIEGDQGQLVTPMGRISQARDLRIKTMQDNLRAERDRRLKDPFFIIGDTLSDIGRTFLSPLFWLGGQDSSAYDPSERLKTGYRSQFQQLEELRYANVENLITARTNRQSHFMDMLKTRRQLIEPFSAEAKEIFDYARSRGVSNEELLSSPELYQRIADRVKERKGEFQRFGYLPDGEPFYVPTETANRIDRLASAFETSSKASQEAILNYSQLKRALEGEGGAYDVAAIIKFMKTLDPTSAVLQGEQEAIANLGGVASRFKLILENLIESKRITSEIRQQINALSDVLVQPYMIDYEFKRKNAVERGFAATGVDRERINDILGLPLSELLGSQQSQFGEISLGQPERSPGSATTPPDDDPNTIPTGTIPMTDELREYMRRHG